MKVIIEAELPKCPDWNYENHTCKYTCRGCMKLTKNEPTETGIYVGDDRYCLLDIDLKARVIDKAKLM